MISRSVPYIRPPLRFGLRVLKVLEECLSGVVILDGYL